MDQHLLKKDEWRKGAELLSTANSDFNGEQAVWSFNILDMETLVSLGEDPEVIAEEITSGIKASVSGKLAPKYQQLVEISIQTDGSTLTLVACVNHATLDDAEFTALSSSLADLLQDFFD